jgi:type IV secretion system protein VirB4
MEAFLGSLPGHGYHNIRRPLIHSLQLADLLPLTSVWPGLEHNPCPYYPPDSPPLLYAATAGTTPFRLSLHVSDVGHSWFVGHTGGGKSVAVGTLAAQHFRYPGAQVFMFDKGYSAYVLCKAMGGAHYDLSGENQQIAFYPLGRIDEPDELNFACEWIECLLECQRVTVTHVHRKEIRASLIRLAAQENRTLTNYQGTVQNEDIKNALEFYTLSGQMGHILDADHDSFGGSQGFHVFEMSHLMEKGEACIRPTMLYLFHRLEQRLTGAPTLIIVEEGHTFLKGQFGARLATWLRELRKRNAAVVFLTQSLSEIVESEHKHILLNSCKTQIFLPDPLADVQSNAELYRAIGLSDRQIEVLKTAVPKRDYYYTSILGRRLIDFGLGIVALSFVGQGADEKTRAAVDKLEATHGHLWVYHWLKQRGQAEWATYWLSLLPAAPVELDLNEEIADVAA